uniref:FHA domain-containing protein DDL n=1 Tax=Anthurium amnicola TaxID=1678845 RepID=A0A1D1YGF1_9ARAE
MSTAMHRRSPARWSSSDLPKSPIRDHPSPRRSSPQRDHRRISTGTRSPVRNSYYQRTRSPTRDKLPQRTRSPRRGRSRSPVKEKVTHRAKSPVQGSARSPPKEKLPQRTRSPKRFRSRSPVKEKVPDLDMSPRHVQSRLPTKRKSSEHVRSPKQLHSSSPMRPGSSRSPSPRTKRLRQAQVEHEVEKSSHMEEERNSAREDKRRNRERGDDRDASDERRLACDKGGGGTSRSSRHIRDRSTSPAEPSHRGRYSSQSPPRASRSLARDEVTGTRGAEQLRDDGRDSVAKMKATEDALEEKKKQKPSFELSGKLAEETNRFRGVTLLFTEPPDARKPDIRWRLYVFKSGEVLSEPLYVHRQSCYLFGRERRVADIPTDHPSCSKQHAVLQFRLVEKEQPDGLLSKQVRPYVMDLGSTNGTFLNDERIEPQRYYELREKDIIKFGNSSREYVLLHENSVK